MEIRVAGGALIDVATKDDLTGSFDRLAKILEKPHARYFRAFGGRPPRAGNLPFVIQLQPSRPPNGMMWMVEWVALFGDDPTAGAAQGGAAAVQTDVDASSANPAAANNVTLPGLAGATTYITGFEITGDGATAGSIIAITVTGILGGTKTYYLTVPLGLTAAITPLLVEFVRPIPASGLNTAIVVNVPSFGAGNTNAAVTAHGFQQVAAVNPTGGPLANVRGALFAGNIPTDASLAGTTTLTGHDAGSVIQTGIIVPSTSTIPDKSFVYSQEDLYAIIAGAGTVAGAGNYRVVCGLIELPQTREALLW